MAASISSNRLDISSTAKAFAQLGADEVAVIILLVNISEEVLENFGPRSFSS